MVTEDVMQDWMATDVDSRIDFIASWRAYLLENDRTGRLDASADQAFWRSYAPHYDLRTGKENSCAQTLAFLSQLVDKNDTLLDVGAGTGRFALPLAAQARHVTALDYSTEMLAILRQKAAASGITNLSVLERSMEEAPLPSHDVVLAAWSLYRQLDLAATLERLVQAARRLLIVVAGDAWDPPHRPFFEEIWGPANEPAIPAYLYILGALHQIGKHADLHVVWELKRYLGSSARDIATSLAPVGAAAEEIDRLTGNITPLLSRAEQTWSYDVWFAVGVVTLDFCREKRNSIKLYQR